MYSKLLVVLIALIVIAECTHFRYGTVSFNKGVNPRTVTYKYQLAMRRSFFGSPNVGNTLYPGNVYFDGGSGTTPGFVVTNIDSVNDIVYCTSTLSFTYTTGGRHYSNFLSNARISNLNNNADGDFTFFAYVNITAAEMAGGPVNDSPVSGLLPIVAVPQFVSPYSYQIVATDPDGDGLTYRVSTQAEMSGVQPTALTCSSSGLVTIATQLRQGFWSTQQTIIDTQGQSISVDYLLSVQPVAKYCNGPCGNAGTCYSNGDCNSCGVCVDALPRIVNNTIASGLTPRTNLAAPAIGSTITLSPGQSITVSYVADDQNLPYGSTIKMYFSGVPSYVVTRTQVACTSSNGCTYVGNYVSPQLLQFVASPTTASAGQSATICVGVTSNNNALPYSQYCVNIAVTSQVCGNGVIEGSEACDGGDCCDSTCNLRPASYSCRASAGDCDVAETCTGSSASCPADSFQSSSVVCRTSAGDCDAAETCTGSSASCPADTFQSSSVVCRTSAGDCDAAETCTGSSASCPVDSFQSSSVVCRASAGDCDDAETCTGSSVACPADTFKPSTVECRASAGDCDVAETCTGSSSSCPADSFQSSSVVCRTSAGDCDVAETCTGSSSSCPADTFKPSSVECRASAGNCDVAESCTGSSASCPADSFKSSSTVCRAQNGVCDVAEKCTGSSISCPVDSFNTSTPCQAAKYVCPRMNPTTESSFYCTADGRGFYQCISNPLISGKFNCAAGTSCGCPYGSECSCRGQANPCTIGGVPPTCY